MSARPQHEQLEALERAVREIEALDAIYGREDGEESGAENNNGFVVHSKAELNAALRALEGAGDDGGLGSEFEVPQLNIEVRISVRLDEDLSGEDALKDSLLVSLLFRLPQGYPDYSAAMVTASVDGLRRAARDELSAQLAEKAKNLTGDESIMELVEEAKDLAVLFIAQERRAANAKKAESRDTLAASASSSGFGRRWIWVHHIKDTGRRRSIVREARDLNLGGYLKGGYPGIVVVEGDAMACDEFVMWIKGNKSRPGGFGRNWGHHVRGEVDIPSGTGQLPVTFEELEEGMGTLGKRCKERGLEDEFKEYVMQHTIGKSKESGQSDNDTSLG